MELQQAKRRCLDDIVEALPDYVNRMNRIDTRLVTADFERLIKQVRERAECFTGSQNKPKTKKAYQ